MLQRKQTLWLLLAALLAFLSIQFPFYAGNVILPNAQPQAISAASNFTQLNAKNAGLLILILTVSIGVASLITIFLYSNRKKQILLSSIILAISVINIFLYYLQIKQFVNGNYTIFCLLVVLIPILLLMAILGMYKDEKLVKSLDRIR